MFDSHNHLQDHRLSQFRDSIVETCQNIGVKRMVVNGTEEQDWPLVYELSQQFPHIIPSFGLHPWKTKKRSQAWKETFVHYLDSIPSAVGEIGLDRWIRDHDIEDQEIVFREQLTLAAERNLPTTIHCLKAWGKLKDILESNPIPKVGFLLHSYGGPAELIQTFVKQGAYFSISGYFAHERKKPHLATLQQIPLDRLLLETDAPDMLPPEQNIRYHCPDESVNHPANIETVYEFAADLYQLPIEALKTQIEENFNQFFASVI